MGLRRRLDQIQAEANQTMADAQALLAQASKTLTVTEKALLELVAKMSALTALATSLVVKTLDGVSFEAELFGKKFPGKLNLTFDEEEPQL
jgi:hypothetical protein